MNIGEQYMASCLNKKKYELRQMHKIIKIYYFTFTILDYQL